jgi:hypothetical protein
MGKWDKLRQKVLLGESDANIAFGDLCHLLRRMGFGERISGSHHIFSGPVLKKLSIFSQTDGWQKTIKLLRFVA